MNDASNRLYMYVVYRHPKDFPNSYVVRRWRIAPGYSEPDCDPLPLAVYPSLDGIYRANVIPVGSVKQERHVLDDPAIYEVWL